MTITLYVTTSPLNCVQGLGEKRSGKSKVGEHDDFLRYTVFNTDNFGFVFKGSLRTLF